MTAIDIPQHNSLESKKFFDLLSSIPLSSFIPKSGNTLVDNLRFSALCKGRRWAPGQTMQTSVILQGKLLVLYGGDTLTKIGDTTNSNFRVKYNNLWYEVEYTFDEGEIIVDIYCTDITLHHSYLYKASSTQPYNEMYDALIEEVTKKCIFWRLFTNEQKIIRRLRKRVDKYGRIQLQNIAIISRGEQLLVTHPYLGVGEIKRNNREYQIYRTVKRMKTRVDYERTNDAFHYSERNVQNNSISSLTQ